MTTPKHKITNRKQFECLVKLMEKNQDIATGMKLCSRSEYNHRWNIFSAKLNILGPPFRKSSEWQKVWADFRRNVRNKMAHNKIELKKTDGGKSNLCDITNLEEKVANILCVDKVMNEGTSSGRNEISEVELEDIPLEKELNDLLSEDTIENVSNQENFTFNNVESIEEVPHLFELSKENSLKNNIQAKVEDKQNLLQKPNDYLTYISKQVGEISIWLRKTHDLEKEKLKLKKEKFKEKQKQHKKNMKYKMELLEYKKQKLELEYEKIKAMGTI